MLGVSTGGRISELLSLTIGDVYQNRRAVTDLLFDKSIVKGGEVSRAVPLNADGRRAIDELVSWHREKYKTIASTRPLFPSRNRNGTVPMNRQTAHEMLKQAFLAGGGGLNGKLATHSLRKSFAQRVYEQSGDIYLVQELLGHRSVSTTQKYLGVNYATAREFVEAIAIGYQRDLNPLLSRSLKTTSDENLLRELACRGYDLSKRRDKPTTAEIIKIG